MKMTNRDLKKVRTADAESLFRAKHGMSREDWVKQQMRAGVNPPKAEDESRRLMAEAVDAKLQELDATAKLYRKP